MPRLRGLLSAAAAVILATSALTALTGTPASAALPNCNARSNADNQLLSPIIPTYNGNHDCVMGQGNVSDGVWALQRTLVNCYGQSIAIDSAFGAQTRAALITVQRRVGVSADGVYGPATRSHMLWSQSAGAPGCVSVG